MYKTKFRQRLCRNRKILPRILRTKPRREGPDRCGHFRPEHAIPTSFSPDFSGQKWTLRKSSGGQNGWGHTSDANSEFTRKLWRAKKFRAVSSVVERLVYTERVGGSNPSPPRFRLPIADLRFAIDYLKKAYERRLLRHGSLLCREMGCRCESDREELAVTPCPRE